MKFDLSRLLVTSDSHEASELKMVRDLNNEIHKCKYSMKNSRRLYMLLPSQILFPPEIAPKHKSIWEKFAETKNIKKNKKVFCKAKKKYVSLKSQSKTA